MSAANDIGLNEDILHGCSTMARASVFAAVLVAAVLSLK